MTTFQAIVYSIIQAFAEFFPVSAPAHSQLIPALFNWPPHSAEFEGAVVLGAFFGVLAFFRYDWLSFLSSFIKILIFRKKPMSLDEKIPFFLLLATLPSILSFIYFPPWLQLLSESNLWICGGLIFFALPLWFFDNWSRKNKSMVDWTWFDAIFVGVLQAFMFLPGFDRTTGALLGCLLRNFNRETCLKFTFYLAAPLLAGRAIVIYKTISFQSFMVGPELSRITFWVTLLVSFFTSLLAMGSLLKQVQKNGFGNSIIYRFIFGATAGTILWLRLKGLSPI